MDAKEGEGLPRLGHQLEVNGVCINKKAPGGRKAESAMTMLWLKNRQVKGANQWMPKGES